MSVTPFFGVFLDIRTPRAALLLRPSGAHHEKLATNTDLIVLVEAQGRRARFVIPAGALVKRRDLRLLRPRLLRRALRKGYREVFSPAAIDSIYVAAIHAEMKTPLWFLKTYRIALGLLGVLRHGWRYNKRRPIPLAA